MHEDSVCQACYRCERTGLGRFDHAFEVQIVGALILQVTPLVIVPIEIRFHSSPVLSDQTQNLVSIPEIMSVPIGQ